MKTLFSRKEQSTKSDLLLKYVDGYSKIIEPSVVAHLRIWSNREILKQYKRRKWLQWLFLQTICIFGNFHYFAYKYEDSISYEREESYEIEKTYWVMP